MSCDIMLIVDRVRGEPARFTFFMHVTEHFAAE